MEIAEKVKELVAGYCADNGIEIIDIVYRREGGSMTLRIVADTDTGIQLADCEKLSRYTEATLDAENMIDERYVIEVSSPGLDRPLVADRDFRKAIGEHIEVETTRPVEGKRYYRGFLEEFSPSSLLLRVGKGVIEMPRDAILRARRIIGRD